MQLLLKKLDGRSATLEIPTTASVADLKTLIFTQEGIPDGILSKQGVVEQDRTCRANLAHWVAGTDVGEFRPRFSRRRPDSFCTLVQRVMHETNVVEAVALQMTTEYAKFLELKMATEDFEAFPSVYLSPPEVIDRVWHLHILDTRFYQPEMEELLGHELEHDPDGARDGKKKERAFNTVVAYRSRFGGNPPDAVAKLWQFSPDVGDVWAQPTPEDAAKTFTLADKEKSQDKGQQILIYAGKQLENEETLASHGIVDQSTVHMVLRLSGC
tara:strand:+ start:4104 stop:4913 length:810 start_codon:yes stop_codon:yes gene_type:complete